MSPDTVARWQFGITTVYHFLFVPLTIALSVLTAVLQSIWVRSGNDAYLRLTKFFGKLFLINFAMGVVTGIVQEFQFGMNWSEYSRFVGDIFGAPLALEALIAFFLESTFLGMWIFGWDRLSKGVHLATIWLGAAGTFISSIFIIAANAWMQNPVGAIYVNGRAQLNDFVALLTNPVFLTQWPHTIAASFVTAGAFMAAVAFYRLIKANKENPEKTSDLTAYRKGLKLGAWVLIVAGLAVVVTGDLLGKTMVETQPTKMAAAENIQESFPDGKAPFQLLPGVDLFPGFLNWLYGTDHVQSIPELEAQYAESGFLQWDSATNTAVPGNQLQQDVSKLGDYKFESDLTKVTDIQDEIIPSTAVTFWSFRIMIAVGCLAILGGILLLIVTRKDKIPAPKPIWTAIAVALPLLPLIANSFGWIFTEMGRQPWIVNGVLPVAAAVSPTVSTFSVILSMALYTLIYAAGAVVEVGLLLKFIKIGLPDEVVVSVKSEGEELSFAY
ncbi:MAG: cytochrome ubiquinol oxidase subunit I [Propionibacteriaceae bacterium]|jgi:cytochrome d ubiquinol oxidase subunit I|nr:cytochrome ubiquinol oxidase subunit I [Propionibacteriaceae bacterium]